MSTKTEPVLNMKPYETRRMFSERFATAADLILSIEKAVMVSGQDAECINVEFGHNDRVVSQLALEAECLSDGSVVYNLILTA